MAHLAVTIDARYVQPYDLVWHRGQFARIRALLPHGAERFMLLQTTYGMQPVTVAPDAPVCAILNGNVRAS